LLGLDFGSYDSAQRGIIWDLEKTLFETILGAEWAEVWCSITQNPNLMKSKFSSMIQVCCRNSGEMTTSLMNTLLTKLMIMWNLNKVGLNKCSYNFAVEGDDSIIGIDVGE